MLKKYDYVLQSSFFDCGIACLMTIFLYHNKRLNRNNLVSLIDKEKNGISMYDLIEHSKINGLPAMGVKSELSDLHESLPCIAHTIKEKTMYHYIVILEINKDNLLIMDPSYGIKKISLLDFDKTTTNKYIIFSNTKFKKTKDIRLKKILLEIFKNNKTLILKSILISLIYSFFSLLFNYYLSIIIESNKNISKLLIILVIFINITLIKTFILFLKNKLLININYNIDDEVTSKVISHLIHLPYDYFIETTTGELTTIVSDIYNFKDIISKVFVSSSLDLIFIIFILISLLFINPLLLLFFVLIIFILLVNTYSYQNTLNTNYQVLKESKIKTSSYVYEALTAFNTIKNLNIENKVSDNLLNNNLITLDNNKRYYQTLFRYELTNSLFNDLFYLFMIIILLFVVGHSSSDLVLLSNIFYIFSSLIFNFYENISMKKVYQTSVDKVLDILELKEEKFLKNSFDTIDEIKFNNVSYKKNDTFIIKNLNLNLKKGENVFIKGNSGIGKSTLIRLLLRNHELSSGSITIDGINIKDYSLSFIRKNITYVSQNETLFQTSINENLMQVLPSLKEVKKSCQTALLDKAFNTTDYLNINMCENGSNLSGGQRKKLIIARALLRAKSFLILDESFNEIDVVEEKMILKNIFTNYPNLTVILISHRQDNINLFDKVYTIKRSDANEKIR